MLVCWFCFFVLIKTHQNSLNSTHLSTHFIFKEVIVKGLAESKTFQKIALRTHINLEQAKKTSTDLMNQGMDKVTKMATEVAKEAASTSSSSGPPKRPPKPP
jgi:hypothetical protein